MPYHLYINLRGELIRVEYSWKNTGGEFEVGFEVPEDFEDLSEEEATAVLQAIVDERKNNGPA